MAMFATLKRENLPLSLSSLGHCNSAPDIMISNWLNESSPYEVSQMDRFLDNQHDVNSLILPSNEFREKDIRIQSGHFIQIDHRSTTDCLESIGQYTLPAIHENKEEESLLQQSDDESLMRGVSDAMRIPSANIIKHNSLPSEFLTCLAREELNQRSSYIGQANLDDSGRCSRNDPSQEISLMRSESQLNHNELLRQSSYPTALSVQIPSVGVEEMAMRGKLPALDVIGGPYVGNVSDDGLDYYSERLNHSFRKRGREAECQMLKFQPREDAWCEGRGQHGHINEINRLTVPSSIMTTNMEADVVVCKSRAKRGFATDPRSIAERIRRTKISDGMKKLHDLLPNTDKQAHTADMLDEVVLYVRQLQRRVQELSEDKYVCAKCKRKQDVSSCLKQ